MKRVSSRLAAVLAVFLLSMPAVPAARGEIVNGIAAKAGNTIITINEFNRAYTLARKQALLQGNEPPSKKSVMDELIDEALVRAEGERRGIVVTDEEVNDIIENVKRQNKFDDERFNEQLALEGLTLKDLKAQYTREMMKARLINLMGAEKNAEITDVDVRKFYDDPANRERLSVPGTGSVTLFRIFIPVPASASYREALDIKTKATSAYERAMGGEDFQALVKEYSLEPDKSEMGTFSHEQLLAVFSAETVNLILSLEEGGVTPPLRSKDGYSIIRIEKKNPETMISYEESREFIRGMLFKKLGDEQFAAWIKQKRQMIKIEYMVDTE